MNSEAELGRANEILLAAARSSRGSGCATALVLTFIGQQCAGADWPALPTKPEPPERGGGAIVNPSSGAGIKGFRNGRARCSTTRCGGGGYPPTASSPTASSPARRPRSPGGRR